MSQQNTPAQRIQTILSDYTTKLVAPPVDGGKRSPTLAVGYDNRKNRLEFVVYSNVEGDKDNGRIIGVINNLHDLMAVTEAVEIAHSMPSDWKPRWEIKATRFVGGKPSDGPLLDNQVFVGKEEDGRIYLAVTSWDKARPAIKFHFGPQSSTRAATLMAGISPADQSRLYASGWAKSVRQIVTKLMTDNYTPPPPRDNNGGNRWGGNQQQQQQQSSPSYSNDDLPF